MSPWTSKSKPSLNTSQNQFIKVSNNSREAILIPNSYEWLHLIHSHLFLYFTLNSHLHSCRKYVISWSWQKLYEVLWLGQDIVSLAPNCQTVQNDWSLKLEMICSSRPPGLVSLLSAKTRKLRRWSTPAYQYCEKLEKHQLVW